MEKDNMTIEKIFTPGQVTKKTIKQLEERGLTPVIVPDETTYVTRVRTDENGYNYIEVRSPKHNKTRL